MVCWEAQKGFCPRKGKGKECKWCQGPDDPNWYNPNHVNTAGKGKGKAGGGGGGWQTQSGKGGCQAQGGKGKSWQPQVRPQVKLQVQVRPQGRVFASSQKGGSTVTPAAVWKPTFDKKGKGKGKDRAKQIDNSLKVWVGGLPAGISFGDLQTHFNQAGETTWAEVHKDGTACVCFKTEEEVDMAVSLLNGSELQDYAIEVDTWVRKPKGGGK
eukprot:TRINITY_DN31577_c0_g2_i1.p2 TRINITY_DN31577_c0_g2~~TRINITY_DN31577_c0_g2_i1.p2  ORF type:complete len:232 (+),score=56.48 TRINITY_DN31577_c0_g2_i1:63-698(+)